MTDDKQTRQKLFQLHAELTEFFSKQLKDHADSIKGSSLDAMRRFLKDNSITRREMGKTRSLDLGEFDDIFEAWSDETDSDDNQEKQEGQQGQNSKQDFGLKFMK